MLSPTDRQALLDTAAELERRARALRIIADPPPALRKPEPLRGVIVPIQPEKAA